MVYTADSIRNRIGWPIRFEIRFEHKKTIRSSLRTTLIRGRTDGVHAAAGTWSASAVAHAPANLNIQPNPHQCQNCPQSRSNRPCTCCNRYFSSVCSRICTSLPKRHRVLPSLKFEPTARLLVQHRQLLKHLRTCDMHEHTVPDPASVLGSKSTT